MCVINVYPLVNYQVLTEINQKMGENRFSSLYYRKIAKTTRRCIKMSMLLISVIFESIWDFTK